MPTKKYDTMMSEESLLEMESHFIQIGRLHEEQLNLHLAAAEIIRAHMNENDLRLKHIRRELTDYYKAREAE